MRMIRNLIPLLALASAALAVTGCGQKTFTTEEFADEANAEGAQMILGAELYSNDPDVTVHATTVIKDPAQDVQVTVVITGTMPNIALDLSSDPSLSSAEIASLIATGRSDVALASSGWIVGEQAGALLLGRFTRAVARQLIDLGIDQVDIQPELLAREGNPSARFTFGKQLTPTLRLIY